MVLRSWLGQAQSWVSGVPVSFAEAFNPLAVKAVHFNLLIYWVIVSVTHAFAYYRQYQERALRASELEKRLAQAKLQALADAAQPAFPVQHAQRHRVADAQGRESGGPDDHAAGGFVALCPGKHGRPRGHASPGTVVSRALPRDREDAIRQPADGADRDPDQALEALVPNLILQPLVENAIKHGIERRSKPGLIELRASCEDNRLRLTLTDNGPGLPAQPGGRKGIGWPIPAPGWPSFTARRTRSNCETPRAGG
jgi:two-component system, LytTR family, sensor kinase